MTREQLFPDAHTDGIDERVEAHWDLDWPLPVPRFPRVCPCAIGGSYPPAETLVVKDWKLHQRTDSGTTHPWRCDVRLKCVRCSLVQIYGVRIPRAYYEAAHAALPRRHHTSRPSWISWREGKALLAEAGFFERS